MRVEKSLLRTTTGGRIVAVALLFVVIVSGLLLVTTTFHPARGQERVQDVDADIRISAQRLEGGDVRFGLRVRDASGGWAAPVTPRAHRFDPANVRVGRWLVSSPLVLEVDRHRSQERLVRSQPVRALQHRPRSRSSLGWMNGPATFTTPHFTTIRATWSPVSRSTALRSARRMAS